MKEQSNKHQHELLSDSRESQITPDSIRAQLDRVLSSPDLRASKKVKTIFRYLTEEKLAGRDNQINAEGIASMAHSRPVDPNTSIDPLVRIQVNQLRRALKRYDATDSVTDDGPRIEMPDNSYAPVFRSEKK